MIAVHRSKLLALAGQLSGRDLDDVREQVLGALCHARRDGPIAFSDAARERWIAVYPSFQTSGPGCTAPRPLAPKLTPRGWR